MTSGLWEPARRCRPILKIRYRHQSLTKNLRYFRFHATLGGLPCHYQRLEEAIHNIHAALIARCRTGDQAAHQSLYKLYSRAMYNVGYRIVHNEEEAQDVLQEAFISAFRNLDSYRGDASFGSWLKRIVVNKALNALNRRKFEPIPENEDWDVAESEAEGTYRGDLTVEKVKEGIAQLPTGYRTVLSLYLIEGYDHQEIAEIMGFTESTSKSQLNRAKQKLREMLDARPRGGEMSRQQKTM